MPEPLGDPHSSVIFVALHGQHHGLSVLTGGVGIRTALFDVDGRPRFIVDCQNFGHLYLHFFIREPVFLRPCSPILAVLPRLSAFLRYGPIVAFRLITIGDRKRLKTLIELSVLTEQIDLVRMVEKVIPEPPGAGSVDDRNAGKFHINRVLLPEPQAVFPTTGMDILAKKRFVLIPHKAGRMVQSWNQACVNLKGLYDLLVEALVIEDARRTVNVRERKKRLQNYLLAVTEKATNTAVRRL